MGGEITAAINGGLRKSAKEVLGHTDDLKKTAKNADELRQIDEVIEHLQDVAGMAENIFQPIKMSVDEFEAGLKRLSKIKPDEALENLDEAIKYFNHHVVDGRIAQVSDINCVNVVEVVEEFLRTGKIKLAQSSNAQNIFNLEKIYKRSFLEMKIPSIKAVMKEGERGIIF